MLSTKFRASSAARHLRSAVQSCSVMVALLGAAGCADSRAPRVEPAGSSHDDHEEASGGGRSSGADASVPWEEAGSAEASGTRDSGGAPAAAACPQGSTPYEVRVAAFAIAEHGCRVVVKVNGDDVDVYFPRREALSPALVVMQGAKVDKSFYSRFAEQVSSYGIVVAVANHSGPLGTNFTEQKVFNDVWDLLRQTATRGPDPLRGRVDPEHVAVLGHSFGGTASMNLAQNTCSFPTCMGNLEVPEELEAALFYGFNNTNPMTGQASRMTNHVPLLFIAGEFNDADKVEETFRTAENNPKVYVMVKGANHYGITNENNPAGAEPDTDAPTVAQEEAIEAIADWSGIFLRTYLVQDQAARDYLHRLADGKDKRVELQGSF